MPQDNRPAGPPTFKCRKKAMCGCLLAALGFMLVFLPCKPVEAKTPGDVVIITKNGLVNWSRGYMETRGVKSPGPQTKVQDAAAMALAQARLNMIRLAGRLRLDAFHRIKDLFSLNVAIGPGIKHMVGRLPIFRQQYLSDGTAQITLRMSLLGGFSQLVLPAEIKPIELIQELEATASAKPSAQGRGPSSPSPGRYTGLVVDARDTGLQPALFPHIIDENGREVYGSEFVSREFAVQHGISGYFTDLQTAMDSLRVKGHPLIVKAVSASGPGKSDAVIRQGDAVQLLSVSEHLAFLRECRVAIVVSDQNQGQGGS